MEERPAFPAPPGDHGLFGLRNDAPAASFVALALTRAYRVRHDLDDLGMAQADWARLFSLSRG